MSFVIPIPGAVDVHAVVTSVWSAAVATAVPLAVQDVPKSGCGVATTLVVVVVCISIGRGDAPWVDPTPAPKSGAVALSSIVACAPSGFSAVSGPAVMSHIESLWRIGVLVVVSLSMV